ncbi:hypothetical protein ACIRYZ_23670 [Kitasatospora sp. NPDC101155]|uniref:hypothetical protein n=1 Tax=Kitasatospora sp. NPDC101155 TaxID=3364097 RepID=UPI0038196BF2
MPNQAVYAATRNAARTRSEGLRREAGDRVRVTVVSPGFVRTDFIDSVPDDRVRAGLAAAKEKSAIRPEAVAKTIAFAVAQADTVDIQWCPSQAVAKAAGVSVAPAARRTGRAAGGHRRGLRQAGSSKPSDLRAASAACWSCS